MNLGDPTQQRKRRVAVYIRVSTAEQKIEGYGLEAQEKRLTEYVAMNGASMETKPEWFYSDTHTGSDINRENLQRLFADVKARKFDAILVWKIDRLSRSLKHLITTFEEFQKNDVSFISVQENIDFKGPIGGLIFQIFGAIAQFERELIKGRTKMGRIASAESGNYTGTYIPYGYKPKLNLGGKGKTIELIPDEMKWVEQIYDWYIFEGLGDGQIANKLNELKVPKYEWEKDDNGMWVQRLMGLWTDKMVTPILTRTLYRGEFVANTTDEAGNTLPDDKWTVTSVPPCVSEFTFQQATNIRESKTGGATDTDYLLSGKLKDITLEKTKTFTGAKRTKGGFSYRRKQFKLKDGSKFPVFEVPGKQIEAYAWQKIMEAMQEPEVFIKHYLSKEYADPTKVERLQHALNTLRERRVNTELAIGRIESAYDHGTYSEEKMATKVAQLNNDMADIDNKVQEIEDQLRIMSAVDVEVQKLREASEQVKYRMEKLDRKQQKILCNLFLDKVEMRRVREGKKWRVQAQVFFRFNPKKFTMPPKGDRTETSLAEAKNGALEVKKSLIGGRGWS